MFDPVISESTFYSEKGKKNYNFLSLDSSDVKSSSKFRKIHVKNLEISLEESFTSQPNNILSTMPYSNKIFKLNCLKHNDFPDKISYFEQKDCEIISTSATEICDIKVPQ